MATHQGRHRHSFATTTTLLALFVVFSRYQLAIHAFQPQHCHCVGISSTAVGRRTRTSCSDVSSALPIITSSARPVPPISAWRRVSALKQQHFAKADADDSSEIQESDKSKSQLSKAYTIGQYLFLSTAVLHLCTVRPSGLFLESEFARSTEWGAAAGFGVAAGVSYILKGALEQDRLNSDTYKRLSVGLLGFCLMGLAAVPGEAAFVALPGPAAVIFTGLVRVYGAALSFTGWKRGVVGAVSGSDTDNNKNGNNQDLPRIMLQEVTTGLVETVKGLRVKNAKKALTYRNCLLLVVAAMFSNFMEGIFDLRYAKALSRTWLDASLQWSAVARLFLISTMIVSLKDAAERDRLTGTTFIQLNRLIGGWAVAVAAGQTLTVSGVAANRGIEMAGFGALFFIKAWKYAIQKKEASKGASAL